MQITRPVAAAALVAAALLHAAATSAPARAQGTGGNPGYFIPPSAGGGGQGGAAPPRPAAPRPQPPRPAVPNVQVPGVQPGGAAPSGVGPGPQAAQQAEPQREIQLPPIPDLPALPRGAAPPAAVIGVLGVPDIMRASSAAQQVDRTIGERREKLNEDAGKEQAAWRELQQQLAGQRSGLTPDQIRTRERELQERITNAQRQFQQRNRVIQEAAQYGLAQIERTLIAAIRQVAESRGMNLVLHRNQVALNINEFDITEQVVEQLNKILPNVTIPPDGVSPATIAQPAGAAAAAGGSGTPATQPVSGQPPTTTPPTRR